MPSPSSVPTTPPPAWAQNEAYAILRAQCEEEARKLFAEFDLDGGGTISVDEMRAVLKKKGRMTDEKSIDDAIRMADINNDNEIDYTEFLTVMTEVRILKLKFQQLDLNKDGVLDASELRAAAGSHGLSPQAMALLTDNSRLTFEDFAGKYWQSRRPDLVVSSAQAQSIAGGMRAWIEVLDANALFDESGYVGRSTTKDALLAKAGGGAGSLDVAQFLREVMKEVMLGGTASGLACIVTNPVDVIKSMMQVAPASERRGFPATVRYRVETMGVGSLWYGVPPAIARAYIYSGTRLGFYSPIKKLLERGQPSSMTTKIAAGITAGSLAAAVANPVEIVKIRMQLHPSRYLGTGHAMGQIFKTEGVGGLFAGVVPHVLRGAVINAAQLASYDQIKSSLKGTGTITEGLPLQFASSMVAGLITTTISSPLDVIKTKVMTDRSQGVVACSRHVYQTMGVAGFFRGWTPSYARMGPQTVISFMIFEQLRKLAGIESL